jgi:Tetratricopeptide repeat
MRVHLPALDHGVMDPAPVRNAIRIHGHNDPETLAGAAHVTAIDLQALGQLEAARDLDKDTLARRRRVLGEDHPDTRTSASNLALDQAAIARERS